MLEAGPMWDSATDSAMFKWPYDSPRRGAATKERHFGEFDGALGGWSLEGEPYTSAPGSQFDWFRSRMLGGRTNHWGRISLRFGPHDFMRKTLDGLGDDWPITYDDMKPYYDKIDRLIGIFGATAEHAERAGRHLPAAAEAALLRAADQAGVRQAEHPVRAVAPVDPDAAAQRPRRVPLLRPVRPRLRDALELLVAVGADPAGDEDRQAEDHHQRDGARGHGRRRTGWPPASRYIDKATKRDNHVRARIVVLAASACESARILLNSKSSKFPQGLANSSGAVGKYLTDSTGASVSGFIPKLMDGIPHNEDGTGGMHLYTPWWLDNKKLDFPRGYHIEPSGGRRMPSAGFGGGIHNFTPTDVPSHPRAFGGYGKELKDDYRRLYGATVELRRPRRDDPERRQLLRDRPERRRPVGHPGAALPLQVERPRATTRSKHMQETFRAIITEMGGTPTSKMPTERRGLRDRAGRPDHPRGRRHAHGQRPVDVGAEQDTARRTTRRTCSSPTAARSSRRPTRTARGRSSRWRCGRPNTSRSSGRAGRCSELQLSASARSQQG